MKLLVILLTFLIAATTGAVDQSTQANRGAIVAENCDDFPQPCFDTDDTTTPIQDAADHLNRALPNGIKIVTLIPKGSGALYEETVTIDYDAPGSIEIRGSASHTGSFEIFGGYSAVKWINPEGAAALVVAVSTSGTTENVLISDLSMEQESFSSTTPLLQIGSVGTSTIMQQFALHNVGLTGVLDASENIIEIELLSGQILFDSTTMKAFCQASASNSNFIYQDVDGTAAAGSLFSMIGGSFTVAGATCASTTNLLRLADAYDTVEMVRSEFGCEDVTTCFSIDEDLADLRIISSFLAPGINHGRLFEVTDADGGVADSTLRVDGISGLDLSSILSDSVFGVNWAALNMEGTLRYAGLGAPAGAATTCFSGWTYHQRDGIANTSLHVCEAGVWGAK